MDSKNELSEAVYTSDAADMPASAPSFNYDVNNTAMQRLARVIASQCRGLTLILGVSGQETIDTLEKRKGVSSCQGPRHWSAIELPEHHDISVTDKCHGHWSSQAGDYETVLVIGILERLNDEELDRCLHAAWNQLGTSGRLVVCVPNEDCMEDPGQVQRFDRKRLRRLLKVFGRPKLVTSQPYRWLTMYVDVQARVSRSTAERHRVIADLCRGRVIELGCGAGALAGAIAASGLQVLGVDMNQPKIDQARQRYPDVSFIQSDILDLDLGGQRFDTVVLAEVLEHVPEEIGSRVLEKAWSLVSDGGRFVISVPNQDCVPHPNHLCEFDSSSLKRLLRPFGRAVIVSDQPYKYLLMYLDQTA